MFLNSANQLIFVIVKPGILFDVRTEFSGLKGQCSRSVLMPVYLQENLIIIVTGGKHFHLETGNACFIHIGHF
jgi:hypothetical protein